MTVKFPLSESLYRMNFCSYWSLLPVTRISIYAVLLISLVAAAPRVGIAQGTPPLTKPEQRAAEEVRRLNGEEVNAFIHNDSRSMARLWSDDFVVTNPLNKFVNKQQVLGMVKSGFLVIPSLVRQIEYLRVYGDIVVVAGSETAVWGGNMPAKGKTERLRFTGVWMKQGGRWQEVARHANVVPP